MCGIAGIASICPVDNRDWLSSASDALRHRGPDSAGEWWSSDYRVGFVHRRLSILDLTAAGHQPMTLENKGLTISFNGEIYNFPELRAWAEVGGHMGWRGHSDTEVLLACIGIFGLDATLHRARGMFAFALHDARAETLSLVRDRTGEKPLYFFRCDSGSIVFASELSALLTKGDLPRKVDRTALDAYLACGFAPLEHCMLSGFHKLLPAHVLEFSCRRGTSSLRKYWEIPALQASSDTAVGAAKDQVALIDELESLLVDSTRSQLVADVPVGLMLSGGLDSSVLAAIATRFSSSLRTFTVANARDSGLDESDRARAIAKFIGSDHVEIAPIELSADSLMEILKHADEPVNDSSLVPTSMICKAIRRHCSVAIGGDGGDELFGGYVRYWRTLQIAQLGSCMPCAARRAIGSVADRVLPRGLRGRVLLSSIGQRLDDGLPAWVPHFDPEARRRLLGGAGDTLTTAESIMLGAAATGGELVRRAMLTDFRTYLPDQVLQKVDRSSMRHSLEVRSPILDHRVVEFAFGRLRQRLLVSRFGGKVLLRRLAERLLPRQLVARRKQGFSVPFGTWLRSGPVREVAWDVLLDPGSPFGRHEVRRLLAEHAAGRDHANRIFGLLQFEVWRRSCGARI
jgi:asparagine synthase (glutamine-hydrolysing)